jgi:hypothetical protein
VQELKVKVKGLYSHANELGSVPEGALSVADDVVIDREDIAEPRRGFDLSNGGFSDASYRANKLTFYKNYLLAQYSSNLLAYYSVELNSSSANFTGSGSWTAISGTYAPPSGEKMRFAEANSNLYLTTSGGVYKMAAVASTALSRAGAYKGLDLNASSNGATSTWLANNEYTAYRLVWGYKDANNNLILGTPSQREVFQNTTGGAISVAVRATIPSGVTTDWFYQLYRAAAGTTEPSDEMGLVYEGNPTSTNISNGYVDITDITPDELRGATLYTSASQQGLAAGNEQPPLCKDIAVYKNVLFYANTTSKHRYYLSLLSVGGTNGIAADDTISIGGVTYTGKATENIASAQFDVVTGGSASQNIRDTALSLVRVINRHSSSTVYAYYLSGPDDLPGKILLEERSIGGSSFAVVSSRSTCWSPDLPSSGTTESSTNDRYKHAIYYSKTSEPEATPLANFFFVGSAEKEIKRIVPLRDSLFILKEDGVYRLSGEDSSSFRVDMFDSTARILAPESAVVLNNSIFCLTDQGVVSITESGVQVRSRPIEATITALSGANSSVLRSESFGVSYETERKYVLFVPRTSGDTAPSQAYVFNTFTSTWTRWVLAKKCGIVGPSDDKLYLGPTDSHYVNQERKTLGFSDYVDYGFATTISAVNGTTLTLTGSDAIEAGDVIYQSSTVYAIVESVNAVAGTVTTLLTGGFSAGTADVLKAIPTKIAWVPFTGANPGMLKHYREATILFKKDFVHQASLIFASDVSPSQETETVTGTGLGQWGLFSWGGVPWGGTNGRRPYRVYVPRNKQRCSQLTVEFRHSVGFTNYQLSGLSLIANSGSERVAS